MTPDGVDTPETHGQPQIPKWLVRRQYQSRTRYEMALPTWQYCGIGADRTPARSGIRLTFIPMASTTFA